MVERDPILHEAERLSALRSYDVLDTPPERAFDDVVQLAAQICGTPVALVSLVDDDRQWFKAEHGLGMREFPRSVAFCAAAIEQEDLFTIPDAQADARFAQNPLVTGAPHIRFYAGIVLRSPEGLPLGTVCVIDRVPRILDASQESALRALARQVVSLLELRSSVRQRDEALTAHQRALQHEALLVRELHHRIKNMIAVIQGLAGLTARTADSIDGFYKAFSGRLMALARAQSLLIESPRQTALLADLIRSELDAYSDPERVTVSGPDVELASEVAVPLSMAIDELATISARDGALSAARGHLAVRWNVSPELENDVVQIEWTETATGSGEPKASLSASPLLQRLLKAQLRAEIKEHQHGTERRLFINLPLARVSGVGSI